MLTLQDFIHRSKVLKLYRDFHRELEGLDSTAKQDMQQRIREGFRKHKGEVNKANRKSQLADGVRELQFLRSYASTARRAKEAAGPGAQSWVGSGDEHDIKGRLGEGWPWAG